MADALGGAKSGGSARFTALDLASLDRVRALPNRLVTDGTPLALVVANAGIMACPFSTTVDGFEMQSGANNLGHFVLVNRTAKLLRERSRVVILSPAGEVGGRYCENCHVTPIVSDVPLPSTDEGVRSCAFDPVSAAALWRKSEELVGETF